jgi:hypothetical protein
MTIPGLQRTTTLRFVLRSARETRYAALPSSGEVNSAKSGRLMAA